MYLKNILHIKQTMFDNYCDSNNPEHRNAQGDEYM